MILNKNEKIKNSNNEDHIEGEKCKMTKERDNFFKKINEMFNFETKIFKLVDKQVINNYKDTYFYLFDKIENKQLPIHENYCCDNLLASNIYKNKYYLKDINNIKLETRPEDVFMRISAFIASTEANKDLREKWAEVFYNNLYEGYFIPGGRVLAGAGDLFRTKTLANCFVSIIENDSLEGIYKTAFEAARTQSYGGGIGIDMSQLRPRNAKVHNASDTSTGSVSFMDLFSMTAGLIGQEGRRGAMMLTLDVKHPDVFEFIKVKRMPTWITKQILDKINLTSTLNVSQYKSIQKDIIENTQIRFANISIKVSDEFMQAVEEENTYGRDKILVYKKKITGGPVKGKKSDNDNYSYGISDKDLNNYELIEKFDNLEQLNIYLKKFNIEGISNNDLQNPVKRDFYGDFVLESDITSYDLAIKNSGDFLTYYNSDVTGEIKNLHKARDIWNQFIEGNYSTAEPGLIFWSQMTKYSPSNYVNYPIVCTNPCGEVPLEDGGACNLGSINLARVVKDGYKKSAQIDFELLKRITKDTVRFMDNVVYWNKTLNPLEKQREAADQIRRIGIGVMGVADLFNQLSIEYDSQAALDTLAEVLDTIMQTAYQSSSMLAKEKGCAPAFDYEKYIQNHFYKEALNDKSKKLIEKYGIRNIAIMSIAPTGTISNVVIGYKKDNKNYMGVSGGIEPIFAPYYTRRTEQADQGGIYKIFHSPIQAYIDENNLNNIVKGINDEKELKKILPKHFFKTAHHISPLMRVKFQGTAQKYIDHSISSTVNLPEDIEPEVISDIYMSAWKEGLKGITIYRDGSRFPILSIQGEETKFQQYKEKKFKIKHGEQTKELSGDDILLTPSGKLTTVYHVVNEGGLN
ncbi:MAG: adenosylcobalamin-dependent ribonucleoside-diphosphate reductase [Nanoarchaeota archaeon]